MTIIIVLLIVVILLLLFYRNVSVKQTKENSIQQINNFHPLKVDSQRVNPQRLFDNITINVFMGFVIKKTAINQIKERLSSDGISFNEYTSDSQKEEKYILFSYKTSDINWSVRLTLKDDILKLVCLDYYDPDCFKVFKYLCQELKDRYGMLFNVTFHEDNDEGTETLCFVDKNNPFHFTEIVYDHSPIIHQNNIYINYF